MPANLQERIETVETKTDSLEKVLGQLIASVNGFVIRTEESNKKFKEDIRADTKKFKEEVRADTKKFKEEVSADTRELKAEMKTFKDEILADTKKFKEDISADTRELKAEMKTFKDEIRADTKELKADIRKMNKKWGELSNKMGTMVEDMVAPNIPTIIGKYFGDSDLSFFGIRIKTLRDEERGTNREFDVIAVSKKNFYVVEVKSNPKPEDVKKFIEMLPDLGKYFPDSGGKKIIPVFSGLYIREDLLRHLTRNRIYAMGFGEDTMNLLNFDAVSELRKQFPD